MNGEQREDEGQQKHVQQWNHGHGCRDQPQTDGVAAVMAEPQQFSAESPAPARGRIVNEHQGRIVGIDEEKIREYIRNQEQADKLQEEFGF